MLETKIQHQYKLISIYNDNNVVILQNIDKTIVKLEINELIKNQKNILAKCSLDDIMTITTVANASKNAIVKSQTSFKYLSILSIFFITTLLTANIASSKLISVFNQTMSGGIIVFPFSYIIGDIITEVYGYKRARQLIWGSIACFIFSLAIIYIVIYLPPSVYWHNQEQYALILGSVPRIVIASVISYCFGEFTNSYILAKMKLSYNTLWQRIVISSVVGIVLDTSVFILVSYLGILPWYELITLMFKQYLYKSFIEFSLVPITLWIIAKIKKHEKLDIIDSNTNFNPFSLDVEYNTKNNSY